MEVLNLLVSPIVEIIKCGVPPLVRQIGYCSRYKKNIENLGKKMNDLNSTRADVQDRVAAAKRNLESIKKVVEVWLERVDKETTGDKIMVRLMNGDEVIDEMTKRQCCNGWCFCRSRYKLGKEAQMKMVIIEDLLNEGKSFTDVSDPCSPLNIEFLHNSEDLEAFASRESTKNKVIAALKDEETYVIGLYGMGGIGKTTLMTQIGRQVKEEKFFDMIIMTTVSQKVELKRIQGEIAKKLGLQQLQKVEDESTRAAILSKQLKREERLLMILDDLWATDLDLSDVGIPYGKNHQKGCKVVITTRSLDVCNSLTSQKNIEVGVLSDEDSWDLFKKNVGDIADSPVLQTVAREVVNECGGLPIALVTLGRALRNKDKLVWDDTALQLKRSDFTYIEGMDSKVFSSIKLSYDYLGNEIIKQCFLFCCLFPEDYRISMDELMMYVMGDEGILEDLETLKQARGRLHLVLDKLIASCLLLGDKQNDGGISNVRMHDIVRDVAISIASEEGNGFFVKADMGLRRWLEKGRLLLNSSSDKCLRLSLMKNGISVLPDQPELSYLLSLSLEGNNSLKEIPNNFFERMKALTTLDLSKTGISLLPSSLSCLPDLRTLNLDHCSFNRFIDISSIGKLKKLEILSLQHCGLVRLPKEIGELTNLKLLNLSNNPCSTVPPNVISSLSRLEELYMMESFFQWEVEGTGNKSDASLDEVTSLIDLNTLHLDVCNKGVMLFISMGHLFKKRNLRFGNSNAYDCALTASPPVCHSVKVLLGKVDNLMLRNCNGLKSVGQIATGAGFNNMKSLFIGGCHEMEYLMSVVKEEIPRTAFVALEELYLHSLHNLKEIFHGPLPLGFLDKLKLVELKRCKSLVSIFPHDVLAKVKNLEVLRVEKCGKLNEIFYLKEERVNENEGNVTFPRLREVYLVKLSALMIIWKGVIPFESLKNLKVMKVKGCNGLRSLFSPAIVRSLQQLEKLTICECRGMETIITPGELMDQVSFPHNTCTTTTTITTTTAYPSPTLIFFPNLKELTIRGCDNLKHLFPIRLLRNGLSQLQRLEVKSCKSLNGIFSVYAAQEVVDVVLCQLREMPLENLPNLVTSAKGIIPITGILQNLENLTVKRCNLMKYLLPVGSSQLLKLLEVKECQSLEEIILNNTADVGGRQVVVLPQLTRLHLDDLPSLISISRGAIPFGSLQNLQSLMITKCGSMKHLFPMRLLVHGQGLSKLEFLMIVLCQKMKVIFHNEDCDGNLVSMVLPRLSEVELVSLPKLSSFYHGSSIVDLPSLQVLRVIKCVDLKRLPLTQHNAPKLKKIVGRSKAWFVEELEWEDQRLKLHLQFLFQGLMDG